MRSFWKARHIRNSSYFDLACRRSVNKKETGDCTNMEYRKKTEKSYALTVSRDECILPIMLGKTLWVHNGLTRMPITIQLDMLGNLIGEYILTKKRCVYKRRKNKNKRKR